MRDKLGGTDEMHGVDADAGYENKVLDLMSRKTSSLGAHLMGTHLMGEDTQIVAGPEVNFATLGDDEQIVAGPEVNFATLGGDTADQNAAALALGIPLAALAGYGIYKGASALSSGPSKPWLYKMNPAYWIKSDREKKLTQALHEGGYHDAQNQQDLDLAKQAYTATENARKKEAEIEKYERGIAGKPMEDAAPAVADATSAAAPAAPAAAVSGDVAPGANPRLDKKILGALSKAGYPIQSGSTWSNDVAPATKALDIVTRVMGQGQYAAKVWLLSFFERQDIAFQGASGKVYEVHGGKLVVAAPNAPEDVTLATSKNQKGSKGNVSGALASPWEKSLEFSTSFRTADPTIMRTTGARRRTNVKGNFVGRSNSHFVGYNPTPWEKGLGTTTSFSTIDSTIAPTTGARKRSNAVRGWGSSPWEKGLVDPTSMSTIDSTVDPTTGALKKSTSMKGVFVGADGNLYRRKRHRKNKVSGWGSSPWEKGLVDPTSMSTIDSTVDPTTGALKRSTANKGGVSGVFVGADGNLYRKRTHKRGTHLKSAIKGWGSSPWEKGLVDPTSMSTIDSTVDPTTGALKKSTSNKGGVSGVFVGADGQLYRNRTRKHGHKRPTGTHFVGYAATPWEKGLVDSTVMSTIDPTYMPTTGARRGNLRRSSMHGLLGADVTYFDGPGIAAGQTVSTIPVSAPYGYDPTTGQPLTAPYTPPYSSYSAPYTVPYSPYSTPAPTYPSYPPVSTSPTSYGQYGQTSYPQAQYGQQGQQGHRRRRRHRRGQAGSQTSLATSTTPGGWKGVPVSSIVSGRGAFVGGSFIGDGAADQQLMGQLVARHGKNLGLLAQKSGLASKQQWSSKDVDTVAAGLLKHMMGTTKQKPAAADATLARSVIKSWLGANGATVVSGDSFMGFSLLNTVESIATAPLKATYWLGKKVVQGVTYPFRSHGSASPQQQQAAAFAAAAKRQAAAQQRINAANKAQEDAIYAQQQAQDAADAQEQAEETEAAATAAEQVAAQAQANANVVDPSAISGWLPLRRVPKHFVGDNAKVATTNTPQGQRLRTGASVARKARVDPAVAKKVKGIQIAAKNGNKKAIHQNATIKAGALADHQRLDALHVDAKIKRKRANIALAVFHRTLKIGGPATGLFSKWQPGKGGIITVGADAPKIMPKSKKVVDNGNIPPPIPGVPPDVLVALTAASNTFGVPPMVAASVIAAAKSGDPQAKKELIEASKVYKAAQKGDPSAKRQMASVAADMKSGYAPAAQKAAVLAAAVGTAKGGKNYKMRQRVQQRRAVEFANADRPKAVPDFFLPESYFKIISFGTPL